MCHKAGSSAQVPRGRTLDTRGKHERAREFALRHPEVSVPPKTFFDMSLQKHEV